MRTVERANNNNERSKEASFANDLAAKRKEVMSGTGSKKRGHKLRRRGRRMKEKKSWVSMRMLTAGQEAGK
jgi:hypothetical protein